MKSVPPEIHSAEYFLRRCGGTEFFDCYKADILKPIMQIAIGRADFEPGMKVLDAA